MQQVINRIFIFFITLYRWTISPLFPASCRYYPTCSSYAIKAFQVHPWYRAFWLTVKRIGRCHPWHEGGFDPVPTKDDIGSQHG